MANLPVPSVCETMTDSLSAAVCLSRLSDTDGTGILAIFTVQSVQSVPSCFRETALIVVFIDPNQLFSSAEISYCLT